ERLLVVARGVVRRRREAALASAQERGRGAGEDGDVDPRRGRARVGYGEVAVADVAARGRDVVEAERLLKRVPPGEEGIEDGFLLVEAHPGAEDVVLISEEHEIAGHDAAAELGAAVAIVAEDAPEDVRRAAVVVERKRGTARARRA